MSRSGAELRIDDADVGMCTVNYNRLWGYAYAVRADSGVAHDGECVPLATPLLMGLSKQMHLICRIHKYLVHDLISNGRIHEDVRARRCVTPYRIPYEEGMNSIYCAHASRLVERQWNP